MRRASTRFDEEERRRINDAIIEAESRTSAEILCVVATDSGRYDRAEDMAGLLGGVLAMSAAWVLFQRVDPAGPAAGARCPSRWAFRRCSPASSVASSRARCWR